MAIRIPSLLASVTETTVTTGGQTVNFDFKIPTDVENLIFKQYGTGMGGSTCNIYVETTDDNGTTWYDCGSFAQFATSTITSAAALWLTIPVSGKSVSYGAYGYTGAAAAGTATASTTTGLPILNRLVRIAFVYAGANTSNTGIVVKVYGSQTQR
jgi:hypothetical protein